MTSGEIQKSNPPDQEALPRMSRRSFGALGIALASGAGAVLHEISSRDTYWRYHNYSSGFNRVSINSLRDSITRSDLGTTPLNPRSLDTEAQHESLYLPEDSFVGIEVKTEANDNIALHVAQVEVDGVSYLAPIVSSKLNDSVTIFVGNLAKGEHHIALRNIGHTADINPEMNLFSLNTNNPLARSVLQTLPMLAIRDDNIDNITNDIPLTADLVLRSNLDGMHIAEFWQKFSAEDGGTPPEKLQGNYGRTYDYDLMTAIKTTSDGEVAERIHQGKKHEIIVDDKFDPPLHLPEDFRSQYQIATRNNMISPYINSELFFSIMPDQLQDIEREVIHDRNKAIKVLSYREHIEQGRLSPTDFFILQFISESLGGVDLISPEG